MKNLLSLIAAIILGVIAVLAVQSYINKQKSKYMEKKVAVAVAAYLVDENLTITPAMVARDYIDIKGKTRDMVSWEERMSLLNRTVQKPFRMGEIYLWSQIGEEIPEETLAQKVEKGSRALTLSISGEAAVMDMIHPNDQVDLIGTFDIPQVEMRSVPMPDGQVGKMEVETTEEASFILLQNVTVLAVGQSYNKEATGGNLTVVVTPEEAIYLVFAAKHGQITSILRNPEDVSDLTTIQVINYDKMLDMAALEGLNQKRKQKIVEEIRGGIAREELIEADE